MGNELTTPVSGRDIPVVPWLDVETAALLRAIVTRLRETRPEVLAAILFGSVARHEERPLDDTIPSDVDLLVLVPEQLPEDAALAIHRAIGEAGAPFGYPPREIQTLLVERDLRNWDPLFIENVARDGLLLWARAPLPDALAQVASRNLAR